MPLEFQTVKSMLKEEQMIKFLLKNGDDLVQLLQGEVLASARIWPIAGRHAEVMPMYGGCRENGRTENGGSAKADT
jgi:hypothetical protein